MDLVRRLEEELSSLRDQEEQIKLDISRLKGQESDETLCPVRLEEFMREDLTDFDWLINQLIIRQGVGIIAGDGGTGKSFLAQQMGLCVAAGKRFMSFTVQRPARVLYLAAEGARLPFRERLSKAARTLLINQKEVQFYVQHSQLSKFHLHSDEFRRLISNTKPDLVLCDTLGYFFSGDENDSSDWKRYAMEPMREMVREEGTSFILVHHTNKSGEYGRKGGRGTSAMFDDVDVWLDLNLTKELREDRSKLMDPTEGGKRILWISKNKYSDNQNMAFNLWADFRNAIFEQRSYEPENFEEKPEGGGASEVGQLSLEDRPEY